MVFQAPVAMGTRPPEDREPERIRSWSSDSVPVAMGTRPPEDRERQHRQHGQHGQHVAMGTRPPEDRETVPESVSSWIARGRHFEPLTTRLNLCLAARPRHIELPGMRSRTSDPIRTRTLR